MRNVTMVVPVLMTSCHVSENPNRGPLNPQVRITKTAMPNAQGEPTPTEVLWENLRKKLEVAIKKTPLRALFYQTCRWNDQIAVAGHSGRRIRIPPLWHL